MHGKEFSIVQGADSWFGQCGHRLGQPDHCRSPFAKLRQGRLCDFSSDAPGLRIRGTFADTWAPGSPVLFLAGRNKPGPRNSVRKPHPAGRDGALVLVLSGVWGQFPSGGSVFQSCAREDPACLCPLPGLVPAGLGSQCLSGRARQGSLVHHTHSGDAPGSARVGRLVAAGERLVRSVWPWWVCGGPAGWAPRARLR